MAEDTLSFLLENITNFTNVEKIKQNKDNPDNYDVLTQSDSDSKAILDKLLKTSILHLDAQFKSGRIRQEEYAQAFAQLYQANLQAALQIYLQSELVKEQTKTEIKKQEVYDRQIKGFDDDFMIKTITSVYENYSVFVNTSPSVDNMKFPAIFTGGFAELDYNNSNLKSMDGIMGDLVRRFREITDKIPKPEK